MSASNNQILQINEKTYLQGVSLNEYIFKIATPEEMQAYNEALKMPDNNISAVNKTAMDLLKDGLKIVNNMQADQNQRNKIIKSLKNKLLGLIQNGELQPFGFKLPRNIPDPAIKIPQDLFFNGQINWDNSELKSQGLEFSGIRLFKNLKPVIELIPDNSKNNPLQLPPAKVIIPPAPRVGRPSLKADIEKAYNYLQSQNLIDSGKPMTVYYAPIREYLAEIYPDRAGQYRDMAPETIRNVISSLHKKFGKK